jgi:hypothetical protein
MGSRWEKQNGSSFMVLYLKEKSKNTFDELSKITMMPYTIAKPKPTATVLYGSMYQDQWYVARGNSLVRTYEGMLKQIICGLMLQELET